MSDLLNSASLVMIPSGYKEDTVFSAIPTDGSGDLSFTRASNGTRINSAGLVEVCPWNLVQQSEDFTTTWNQVALTIGANATTAPNGTSTADSFTSTTATANHVVYQLLSGVSGAYTFSVYVKKANSRYVYIKLVGDASQWVAAVFDLNDGTLTKSEATGWTGLSASSQSVGDGWYKLIVSGSGATSVDFNVGIQYTNTGTPTFSAYADASFAGTGTIDYYIWGAQLNIGATAKPYFFTTDRLNVPRLTYQNGGGGCPSLLLEKQSTNLLIYSEQFDQWSTNGTTTANAGISPDGTQNADRLNYTSGNIYWLDASINVTNGISYTYSLYVKPTSVGNQFRFYLDGAFNDSTVITTDSSDWKRYTWTFTASATGSINPHVLLGYGYSSQSILAWGAQLEASSYPTSYIPTTSSSATRVADAIGNQTTSIAQAFTDNTKGTIFFDLKNIKFAGGAEARFRFGNTADALQFAFFMDSVGLGVYGYQGGGYAVNVSTATNQKIAIRFDGTSLTGFSQGVKRNTVTAGTNYVIEQMVGNDTGNLCLEINEFVLFNSVLTDAECIALTTL